MLKDMFDGGEAYREMSERASEGPSPPPTGLCERCRHQQLVPTRRGPVYSLCRRSRDDPERFPRYPRLPVVTCDGFEPSPE